MRPLVRKLFLALGILTLACSSGEITGPGSDNTSTATSNNVPSAIAITHPTNASLVVGTSISLVVAIKNASGQDISGLPITWSSSDPTVATVSASGVLTALNAGTVTITATTGDKTASLPITIVAIPVKTVVVQMRSPLLPGETATPIAVPKDSIDVPLAGRSVAWSTSNPSVATVTPQGVVSAVGPGTGSIIATIDGVNGSASITVLPAPIASISVSLASSSLTQVGATTTATATPTDALGNVLTGRAITWSSSNFAVATVNPAGVVTAVGAGTATITASGEGQSGSATVTVTTVPAPVASVTLTGATQLAPAQSAQVTVVLRDALGVLLTGRQVVWASSNPATATVGQTGLMTGVGQGSTTITATSEGVTGSLQVSGTVVVTPPAPVASVTLTGASQVASAQTTQITIVLRDAHAVLLTGRQVVWASSNPAAATVSQTGLVTGVGAGTTTITATSEGITGSLQVTGTVIVTPPAPVASVSLSGVSQLAAAQTGQVTIVLRDAQGLLLTGRQVVWASSNPATATVSQTGLVTGVGLGTTSITATSEGITGSLQVTGIATTPVVASVSLSAPNAVLQPTQSVQVTAQLRDAQNAIVAGNVTFRSANTGVATLSGNGYVTAISSGTSVITGTSGTVSGTLTITVPVVQTVTVTSPTTTLQPTQSTNATVSLTGSDGKPALNRAFAWSSSVPSVATVDNLGSVTAVAAGSTQITVTSEGVTGFVTITVPPVTAINVTAPSVTLQPTQTTQAVAALLDASGNPALNRPIQWSTTKPAVASVSQSGVVTATGPGTAQIQVTSGSIVGSLTITVPPVATVSVTVPNATRQPTQTMTATVTLKDANGQPSTNRAVTWSSSNAAVATVNQSGVVTGVASGTAQITATSEGKTGSATVTVPPVATVNLSWQVSGVSVGQSQQITASLLDANSQAATNRTVTWQSATPGVATINSSGVVTGVSQGTSVITATSEGKSGTLTVTVTAPVVSPGNVAALPSIFLDTTEPVAPAAGRTIITVLAGGNLQTALNNAQPGDVIELAAGATFSGNFTLPNKGTSSNWIVIRPSNYAQLPAAGQRMTPTIAGQLQLPIIQSPNTAPAIQPNASAHHYRFTGIEVTVATSNNSLNYGLISTDASTGQTQLSQVPHDLVFDRMYIHGWPTFTLRRCVAMNSAYTSVIDSDLRECHDPGQDSQAIAVWNGPGPLKISNNYLEAATENLMFGGADPSIPNMTPSDIEIRGNHIYKPIAYRNVWSVKNLLEIKHAQRVLIEGNILDGSWTQGQVGFGVVLKTVNQNGTCPWCVTQDVTFRYNLLRNVGAGFNIAASPDNTFQDTHARRLTITDNVVSTINVAPYDGPGSAFQLLDDLTDVIIAHNTVMSPTSAALVLGVGANGPTVRTTFRDNIAYGGQYGVIGDNVGLGSNAINTYMPNGTFAGNVLVLTFGSSGFPAGSFYPTSVNTIQFTNAAGGNYALLAGSPYRNAATDGRDPGVDMTGLQQRLANVIVP